MTYRDDEAAESERERSLEESLRGIDRSLAEKPALEARRRELTRAIAEASSKRAKVPLPLLARIEIASPCPASWDEMKGDARTRHCASCDKDVFDLSEMTTAEAEALLMRDANGVCVRLHRRADGTVITSDCPVGAKKKRRRRWLAAGAAVAASAMTAAGLAATTTTQGEPCVMPQPPAMMGAIVAMPPPAVTPPNVSPVPAISEVVPAVEAQRPPARMGHIARPHRR